MSRIAPLDRAELSPELQASLAFAESTMGFVPNDALIMARWPDLLLAMQHLVAVIYQPGTLDPVLKRMIGTVTSAAAGCRYCQAHTAHGAAAKGRAEPAKLAAVWDFQTNAMFTPAERAALALALAAGQQPNGATDAHFETLAQHFNQAEIMEIMGVIGLFGFLNRWNDTLATQLEPAPMAFASAALAGTGWTAGKHA